MKKDMKKSRKKKWWRGERLKSKFKELDIYGESVTLTYKGESSFKTVPGAIATVLVLLTVLAFSTYRTLIFVTKSEPEVSK